MTVSHLIRLLTASIVAVLALATGTATAAAPPGPVFGTGPSVPLEMRAGDPCRPHGQRDRIRLRHRQGRKARLPRRRRLREDRARRLGSNDLVASRQRHERHEDGHGRGDSPAARRARPLRRQPRCSVAAAVVPARGRVRHRDLPAADESHVGDRPAVCVALRSRTGPVGQRLGRPEVRRLADITPGSTSAYKNANYALLRLAIPALWKATGNHPGIVQITKASVGVWYLAYVQQRIFVPSGVNSSRAPSRSPTRRPCSTTRRTPEPAVSSPHRGRPVRRVRRPREPAPVRAWISRGSWRTSRTASS